MPDPYRLSNARKSLIGYYPLIPVEVIYRELAYRISMRQCLSLAARPVSANRLEPTGFLAEQSENNWRAQRWPSSPHTYHRTNLARQANAAFQ